MARKAMSETAKNTEKILHAAIEVFRREGYEQATVRQICEEAGVARSSFYTIFSDKADIIVYYLGSAKADFEQILPRFIQASNDLERIWLLTDEFLQRAVDAGPEFCKACFILEMQGSCHLVDIIESFNEWLIQLVENCQKNGIVRNQGNAALLIPMQVNLAKAILFDWVRLDGSFDLQEKTRKDIEDFLDVSPEFRRTK